MWAWCGFHSENGLTFSFGNPNLSDAEATGIAVQFVSPTRKYDSDGNLIGPAKALLAPDGPTADLDPIWKGPKINDYR